MFRSPFMLAKKYKLPIQDFVGRSGKIVRGPYFFLKIFPAKNASDSAAIEASRFGIVISKKVASRATERNRIKRIIFDFFQKTISQLPINDYLLVAAPSLGKLEKEDTIKELEKLINKIGV